MPEEPQAQREDFTVKFDRERRLPYYTDRFGARVYQERPEGFDFDDSGNLVPLEKQTETAPVGAAPAPVVFMPPAVIAALEKEETHG